MNYTEIFERCIKVILKNEGGYGNPKADSGGETNFGIADAADGKKDGMADIDRDGVGDIKIKDLTVDQAKEIYFNRYWVPMKLDGIRDENVVLDVFDMGVNAGTRRAIQLLQEITGATVDGDCGPQTCRKANYYEGDLVYAYKERRKKYYLALVKINPEKQVFIAGWLNRVDNCKMM
jgi:lysozyme family protein